MKKRSRSRLEKEFTFNQLNILNTPPSSKDKILDVQRVIEEEKEEPALKIESIKAINEPSMKQKYSSLLLERRELVLPYHYKTLLSL